MVKQLHILITSAILNFSACPETSATPPAQQLHAPPGGRNLTFLAAADAHFGADGIEARHRVQIREMNSLPGTAFPAPIGGVVGRPAGVLFAGDLTDHSLPWEWDRFVAFYGLTGKEGLLQYPVFEGTGNHDRVPLIGWSHWWVKERHGGLPYSFNMQDVHFVNLDVYPTASNLRWLKKDLAAVGRDVPVVLYFHYSITGPFSDFWKEEEKEAFAKAMVGYNILGIFHGHYHASGHSTWKGHDVYLIGSPKHSTHRFLAVHINDQRMGVAAWDWDKRRWDWHHVRTLRRGVGNQRFSFSGE